MTTPNADMILAMRDPYMQQIIDGTKTYEFRKYNIEGVQRIWFYRIRPYAAITHVCEVSPAVTRNPGDQPIPENGLGNKEFNDRHPDWNGYDFAYRINSVYRINTPNGRGIRWPQMRDEHGMTIPPRGRVRLPASIAEQFPGTSRPRFSERWLWRKVMGTKDDEGRRRTMKHDDGRRREMTLQDDGDRRRRRRTGRRRTTKDGDGRRRETTLQDNGDGRRRRTTMAYDEMIQ